MKKLTQGFVIAASIGRMAPATPPAGAQTKGRGGPPPVPAPAK
ncbi:MAG: hypothetical protein WDO18_20410 [Acidobacteriota bacterium]